MNQKCLEPPIIPLAVEKENREGCREEQQIDMATPRGYHQNVQLWVRQPKSLREPKADLEDLKGGFWHTFSLMVR